MSKTKLLTESPLLPTLTAVFVVVATFATNAHALEWRQLPIPLAICILPGLVVWLILWLIKDLRFISATASVAMTVIILFYSLIPEVYYRGLMPILVMAASIGLLAIFHKHVRKSLQFVTIALVVCTISSLGLAQYNMIKNVQAMTYVIETTTKAKLPNIYFIIPDRFTSHEALLECGYDNSEFIDKLRGLGFYVRDNALSSDPFKPTDRAASTRTLRYLASVFNDGEQIPMDIDYNVASQKVRYSTTVQKLIAMGYEFHNIGSWYAETRTSALTEHNYIYSTSSVSEAIYSDIFTTAIIDRSIGRYLYISPLLPSKMYAETERNRQQYQLDTFKSLANGNNKLVFMHILLPHPPFIWTADGKPQENTKLEAIELYIEQTKYTEAVLLDLIKNMENGSIVIIQSDEGMCFTGEATKLNAELSNTQFNGILTAWKLPVDNNKLKTVEPKDILKYTRGAITK